MKYWMLTALLLAGCPQPQPPPNPDASDAALASDVAPDAGIASAVCENLRNLGCAEGLDPKCETVIEHELVQAITPMPLSCWASAPTKEAARACGSPSSGHLACP